MIKLQYAFINFVHLVLFCYINTIWGLFSGCIVINNLQMFEKGFIHSFIIFFILTRMGSIGRWRPRF